jgi:hypothetical protein
MQPEFEAKELDVVGEFVSGTPAPQRATKAFVIPPPPWSENYTGDEPVEPEPEAAVAAPTEAEPLKPAIPPPDWAQEERERDALERQEHGLDEEQPSRHPPPTRESAA